MSDIKQSKKESRKESRKESKKESRKESKKESNTEPNITITPLQPLEFKTTPLSISTCTVITNLNSKNNLGLISRFISIYEQFSPELNEKTGGLYNLEFYGNCARGETLIDKIKDEFNNQATIKFKYWGFRNVNIKIFANGTLQMTGLKDEDEAKIVSELLINILKNIKINITTDIKTLAEISKTYDFQLIYNLDTKSVSYYRKYYDRFLKDYEFDTDLVYGTNGPNGSNGINEGHNFVNLNRKNFVKGIHNIYNINSDPLEEENKSFLKENNWNGDLYIRNTIDKINRIKDYFTSDLENTLSNCKTLLEVKQGIEELMKKYTDFKFTLLDKLISDIGKDMFSNDKQTLIDIKHEIFKFNRVYKNFLEKKINRLVTIRTIDITICNYVKEYLLLKDAEDTEDAEDAEVKEVTEVKETKNLLNKTIQIPIEQIELITKNITEPHNYFVSDINTVLINSDFSINHNINLKKMAKLLKKKGLYNSYEPDEYPGVLTKYYYNPNNIIQGICNCAIHCSTKEKHSICTKITISLFRPGSIIITGARTLHQLMLTYDEIIKILKENLEYIKGADYEDDNKNIALMNNEYRKISRKPRLFFIKKTNIIDFDEGTNTKEPIRRNQYEGTNTKEPIRRNQYEGTNTKEPRFPRAPSFNN